MTSASMSKLSAASIRPSTANPPTVEAIWLPLWTGTSAITGGTTASGFVRNLGLTDTTRIDPATLTVTAGTLAWDASGGLTFASGCNGFAELASDADSLAFMQSILNLGSYIAGQTLLIGFEVTTPVNWKAGLTGAQGFVSFGDFDIAATGGGVEVGTTSGGLPYVAYRATDATAAATTIQAIAGAGAFADDTRHVLVVRMQCTAANTFNVSGHLCVALGTVATDLTPAVVDMSDAGNGGTAAPGIVLGSGLRVGGRKEGAANDRRLRDDEIVANVWAAKTPSAVSDSWLVRLCGDMIVRRNNLPPALRSYAEEQAEEEVDLPDDGNADQGLGIITQSDMFAAAYSFRTIADNPTFRVQTETNVEIDPGAVPIKYYPVIQSVNMESESPLWRTDADSEGLLRGHAPGGFKFARTTEAPASVARPAWKMGAHYTDTSSRFRCEFSWKGDNLSVPSSTDFWVAFQFYYDYDFGEGHSCITQLWNGMPTTGLEALYTLDLSDRHGLVLQVRHAANDPVTTANDQIKKVLYAPSAKGVLRGVWSDVVIKARWHWLESEGPYIKVWVNDTQYFDWSGPMGFKSPCLSKDKTKEYTSRPEIRFGNYPGRYLASQPPLEVRNNYLRNPFLCTNVGNYTLAQIRAALAT